MSLAQITPVQNVSPVLKHRMQFKGTGGEYFRLQIVNFALSVLTLGLYSPWAKVRARRYLYGNTYVAGANFQYHGNPIGILKGRLILLAIAGLCAGAHFWFHLSKWEWSLIAILCLPPVLVQGAIFNARNTSYRGIHFDFERDYKGGYVYYGVLLIALFYTRGYALALAPMLQMVYRLKNTKYGTQKFSVDERWGKVFGYYLRASFITAASFVPAALVFGLMIGLAPHNPGLKFALSAIAIGLLLAAPFGMLLSLAYLRANNENFVASKVRLNSISFRSELKVFELFEIYATNAVAIAGSLGLAIPWAQVQAFKYRAKNTYLLARAEELDTFTQPTLALASQTPSAAMGDVADFDFGL